MKTYTKLIIFLSFLVFIVVIGTSIAGYTTHTDITDVTITAPIDGDIVFKGDSITCQCTTSTDKDWDTNCEVEVDDPVTHTWSGAGTFDPTTGTSVTWTTPQATGNAAITVTASDSPLADDTDKMDSIIVKIVDVTAVRVYTSDSYDDNGGDGLNDCQVHFGNKDGTTAFCYPDVYLEIDMDGGRSNKVDTFTLPVVSETDSTGIDVDFTETGQNTNTYRCDDPIHLAITSNQNTLELAVLDEEHISVGGVNGPEVDRGEMATISAHCFSGNWQHLADDAADAVHDFLSDTYFWWNNGKIRNTYSRNTFGNFVKDVGVSYSPADIIFTVSHGNLGNFGYLSGLPSIYKPSSGGTPTITSTDWDDDVEWIILYTCHSLGQDAGTTPAAWIGYWDDALKNKSGDNIPHGILGSSDLMWASPAEDHMLELCDAIKDNAETIYTAYKSAAMDVTPKQWATAYLVHDENTGDKLDDVEDDTTNTGFTYSYYSSFGGYGYDYDPNDPNDPNMLWGGGTQFSSGVSEGYEVLCDIPTDRPVLTKMSVRKEVLNRNTMDHSGFENVKYDNNGRIRFKKNSGKHGPLQLSKAQARAKVEQFISQRGGGMPADADVVLVRNDVVVALDSSGVPQNEYVTRGFLEYRHKINGIEVAGGNRGDSIFVTVADGQVVGFNRHWRSVVGPTGNPQQVISAKDAVDIAVDNIPSVILGAENVGYAVTEIKLFYYGLPSDAQNQSLTPAWGLQLNKMLWVYVDALTGEFLE
jgi:hypothetical protein